jgi:signal peptidase
MSHPTTTAPTTAARPLPRRVAAGCARVAFGVCVLLAAAMLALPLFGYDRYVITGGSMTGTIDRGSVLWAKAVPTDTLKVGDIITYTPPRGSGPMGLVTHRIHSISAGPKGQRMFRTKGDANKNADPWTFELWHTTQARAAFHIPYLGHVLGVLSARQIRLVAFGFPAALIALNLLLGLWREAGEAARLAKAEEEVAAA